MFSKFLNWIATHSEVYQDLQKYIECLKNEKLTLEHQIINFEEDLQSVTDDKDMYMEMYDDAQQDYLKLYRDAMGNVKEVA